MSTNPLSSSLQALPSPSLNSSFDPDPVSPNYFDEYGEFYSPETHEENGLPSTISSAGSPISPFQNSPYFDEEEFFDEKGFTLAQGKKRPFAFSNGSRKKYKVEQERLQQPRDPKTQIQTILSDAASTDKLLKKMSLISNIRTYGPYTPGELKPFQDVMELKKFEELSRIDPYKNSDHNYYTSELGQLSNHPQNLLADRVFVLTGNLEEHPIPLNASESLRGNLKNAKLIMERVHDAIPFSCNYLQRSQIFTQELYDPDCITKITELLKNSLKELQEKAPPTGPLTLRISETLKHKNGTGGNMAMFGYWVAKKMGIPVDLVSIQHGDHGFLLFGRKKEVPVSDYKNWGPDAVICDTLTEAYFPGSEIEKYLMVKKGVIPSEDFQYTLVKNFDPSTQTLFSLPEVCS